MGWLKAERTGRETEPLDRRLDWWKRFLSTKGRRDGSPVTQGGFARRVGAVMELSRDLLGKERLERLAVKHGKADVLKCGRPEDRLQALEAMFGLETPVASGVDERLRAVEVRLGDWLVRQRVEDRLEKQVDQRLAEKHDEYVKALRLELLQEQSGPDNAQTLRRYANLLKLENRSLARSISERMRPADIEQVIGQGDAIRALMAKLASPYPQHVILYGPPGVGKTTVARLVLEHARRLSFTPFENDAPFIEVDGATMRWDPREGSNPLLGSVHDPIYQGSRQELAVRAIPEPRPGLVTEAHGGILFIDEIGELDPQLQAKLLKVLEEKRVHFDSPYYDPDDPHIPKYIHRLFQEGAPANFILVGATTRAPGELSQALRSRCGAVFFDPLAPSAIAQIVEAAAARLALTCQRGVAELIASYTTQGRDATLLLADAYGAEMHESPGTQHPIIRRSTIRRIAQLQRLVPIDQASREGGAIGRVVGLGVSEFIGTTLEIEAVTFAAEGRRGEIRFNDTAGTMARDAVFNAASVVRRTLGRSLAEWDVHVNVVGGGRVNGPSAGAAVALAIISALQQRALRQDVAITGELSLQGELRPVGGVREKLLAAERAGIKKVLVPKGNLPETKAVAGIEVVGIERLEDALVHVWHTPDRVLVATSRGRAG